ncbi:MAG: adenylate/guanylate cyclase domain-containing protein [Candidatus Cloacimonetes bacterium]|nr:adenylate/guanylate cyclase domain-containing protein [Candidatus Cloacimonadota bacterium]
MQRSKINHWLSKKYKRVWICLPVAVIIALLVFGIGRIPFVEEFEQKTLDLRFRLSPIPERADSNIVLIAIDDGSLRFIEENLRQGWPLPREFYAYITSYLTEVGAETIIFDVLFDSPDFDRADIDSEASDAQFADAIAGSGRVFLSSILLEETETTVAEGMLRSAVELEQPDMFQFSRWAGGQMPLPVFAQNAAGTGVINLTRKGDSIVRELPGFYELQGKLYPSLAMQVWLTRSQSHAESEGKARQVGNVLLRPFRMTKPGDIALNWYGIGGVDGVFTYRSFQELLQSAAAFHDGGKPAIPHDYFAGKYVIIGATGAGLMDLKSSPYTWGLPGMEIWATALSNYLNQDFIRRSAPWQDLVILLVIALLVVMAVMRLRSGTSTLFVIVFYVAYFALGFLLFGLYRIQIAFVSPLLAFMVAWLYSLTVSYVMEGRQKKELRLIFNSYLHPELVDKIVSDPDLVELGGEEYEATVMFSDIYDFTTHSEGMLPRTLVGYLNEYFHDFTNSILDHNGLLDKYTGDGLMAIFGVPIARTDHAMLACRAALAHRDYSLAFQARWEAKTATKPEVFHLGTRLGINTGPLVAGNIGSQRRMEYTAIGDAVNLAARLEAVNKIFGTHIIISQSTWHYVKDALLCRELDLITVKGKSLPTRIYELIGVIGDAKDEAKRPLIEDYERALALYRAQNWDEAEAIFSHLSAAPRSDKAARTMKERCDHYRNNPPPPDWDGVHKLLDK